MGERVFSSALQRSPKRRLVRAFSCVWSRRPVLQSVRARRRRWGLWGSP